MTRQSPDQDSRRIPLRGGDEFDALTTGKRLHIWRAGDRVRLKQSYWRRFRRAIRAALRRDDDA